MKKGMRQLACILTASMLFSFFFFLQTTSCRPTPSAPQMRGGFCAVQKASAPIMLSFEDPHLLLIKE
ncbi:MAG: hypothetical protein AAB431_00180, partial [Patescibacteria group bacterium]